MSKRLALLVVSAVIAARLPAGADARDYVDALRGGVVVGAVLPVLGAALAFAGLGARSAGQPCSAATSAAASRNA